MIERSTSRHKAGRPVRVAWIASAYGFGTDLAYYRQIFGEFVRRLPNTVIHVDHRYPVQEYPDLPLRPDFRFFVAERRRTVGDNIPYMGRLRIPTPSTMVRILREQADVWIIIEFTPVALVGWLVAKLRRKRLLLLVECDPAFRGVRPRWWVNRVKRRVALSADAVLTSNAHGLRYLHEELALPTDLISVGSYLTSDPGVSAAADVGRQHVRLLFMNTISARKGIVPLIEALAQLPPAMAERWKLDVVGSGDQEELVRGLVSERGLTERVSFHGRIPHSETPRYYAAADIVVCPTLGDYRSLAGIEAVNAGKGVIVSTWDGATEEILRHAAAAWAVDPTDIAAFSQLLADLLGDRDELEQRLAAARQPPAEFSLDVIGGNLERAVQRARA